MRRILIALCALYLGTGVALAEENQSKFSREVTLKVNGAVCGFCSYGIRKEIYDLPFVDKSRFEKGVRTNSEDQSVTIAVLPEGKVDEALLRKIVTDAGYETVGIEYNE